MNRLIVCRYGIQRNAVNCGENMNFAVAILARDKMKELYPLDAIALYNETEGALVSSQELDELRELVTVSSALNSPAK